MAASRGFADARRCRLSAFTPALSSLSSRGSRLPLIPRQHGQYTHSV